MRTAILLALLALQTQPKPQAYEWYRKGEELIGTEHEFSERQAQYFSEAVKADPDFAAARFNLALIKLRLGEPQEALEQFTAYVRLAPEDPKGFFMKARTEIALDDPKAAIQDLEKGLALDPGDGEAWAVLGRILYNQERYQEALEAAHRASQAPEPPADIDYQMALALKELGRTDEALGHIESFLEEHSPDFRGHYLAAVLYLKSDRKENALRQLLEAEKIDPSNQDLAQLLGNLFMELNRPSEAAPRLHKADPDSALNLANLGVVAIGEKRYLEAEKLLRSSLEKQPSNPLMWGYLGDSLAAQGKALEAIAAYDQALFYDPHDLKSLITAGTLSADNNRPDEARKYLERALEQGSDDGFVHYSLAVVLEQLGDAAKEAPGHFLKALEGGEDRPYAHYRLGFFYSAEGHQDKALEHLEIALKSDPKRFHAALLEELRKVRSDLDSIRYTPRFAALMDRYQ